MGHLGVIAGTGISFLSAHTIAKELHAGSAFVLDAEHFPLMLNWYVVQHRGERATASGAPARGRRENPFGPRIGGSLECFRPVPWV